jgi:hypothetical protein
MHCTVHVPDGSFFGWHHCDKPAADRQPVGLGAGHAVCDDHLDGGVTVKRASGTTTLHPQEG